MMEGEPFPLHDHPFTFFRCALWTQRKNARKRFCLRKMGFSCGTIAPRPPYTPPGTISMGRCPKPRRLRAERRYYFIHDQ